MDRLIGSFKTIIYNLITNECEKYLSSIKALDLNSWLIHYLSPPNTLNNPYDEAVFWCMILCGEFG